MLDMMLPDYVFALIACYGDESCVLEEYYGNAKIFWIKETSRLSYNCAYEFMGFEFHMNGTILPFQDEHIQKIIQCYQQKRGGAFEYQWNKDIFEEVKKELELRKKHFEDCWNSSSTSEEKLKREKNFRYEVNLVLERCRVPRKTLFEALSTEYCDSLEIYQFEVEHEGYILHGRDYNRQRVLLSRNKMGKLGGILSRFGLHVVEGMQINEETARQIKYVDFEFGGIPVRVETNSRTLVKCPFIIPYSWALITGVRVKFIGHDDTDIGYDFDSWVIGGPVQFDIDGYMNSGGLIEVPFVNNSKKYMALFRDHMIGVREST